MFQNIIYVRKNVIQKLTKSMGLERRKLHLSENLPRAEYLSSDQYAFCAAYFPQLPPFQCLSQSIVDSGVV